MTPGEQQTMFMICEPPAWHRNDTPWTLPSLWLHAALGPGGAAFCSGEISLQALDVEAERTLPQLFCLSFCLMLLVWWPFLKEIIWEAERGKKKSSQSPGSLPKYLQWPCSRDRSQEQGPQPRSPIWVTGTRFVEQSPAACQGLH